MFFSGVPGIQSPGSAALSESNPIAIGGSDKNIASSLGDSEALTIVPWKAEESDINAGK